MIDGGTQGGVRERSMSSPTSSSLVRAIEEKHVGSTQDGTHEDAGPIGRIVFTEVMRKEARAWFKKVAQSSPKKHDRPSKLYTPLNSPQKKILDYIRKRGHTISTPARLRSPPAKRRNKHLYCRHHQDYGHTTEECFHLKEAIEHLIANGYLKRFTAVLDATFTLQTIKSDFVQVESSPQDTPRYSGNVLEQMRAKVSRYYNAEELQGQSELLKPQALVTKMNEVLPDETLVFVDNGNSLSWIGQYYEARQTGTVFLATNVASMGYAVAASIGGKVAAPDKLVVALVGDSAFAMNGMEVHTAADYDIPVIWIVLNNGGHGMVYNGETLLCGRSFATVFQKPLDVSTIARGLGVQAFKVTNVKEFEDSLRQALETQEPCVIDALVDLEEIPRSLQRRADTLSAFFGKQKVLVHDA